MAAATNAGQVNINSDLGESFGPWVMGNDAEVLKIVRSANVACGFHASDPVVMMDTVKLCAQNGVSIGAHPGFADLQGFGRRPIPMSAFEIETMVAYQIGAFMGIAARAGLPVAHVKSHGALYNLAEADDENLARYYETLGFERIELAVDEGIPMGATIERLLSVCEEGNL